jgi:hypothetical protein
VLNATPEQLERLINAAQALEQYTREFADDLIDDGSPGYLEAIEDMESDIDAFNAIRREIEGAQQTMNSRWESFR